MENHCTGHLLVTNIITCIRGKLGYTEDIYLCQKKHMLNIKEIIMNCINRRIEKGWESAIGKIWQQVQDIQTLISHE